MNRQGYSIIEALMAMILLSIGVFALVQSYSGITRSYVNSRHQELAVQCARDRMEEIVNSVSYSDIESANYPDENYGEIPGAGGQYEAFARTVAIDDSLNAIGQSVLKEITVQVTWQVPGGTRDVSLNTVVARYKDIQL